MTVKLLLVGDIHLGRRPGLPEAVEARGISPHDLGPVRAWRDTVDEAIRREVDAVLLAGDVVESLRDRFEAFAELERGVSRLVEAGIACRAVVGNHDVEALPRLADRIEGLRLLGRGGRWELQTLEPRAGERVDLLGWSFPTERYAADPTELDGLDAALAERSTRVATLGLLHADLDAAGSPHAPVRRRALERIPVDGWFLGHIHEPGDLAVDRPVGYLGSLVGLDPGEPGPHGPWQVEVAGPGRLRAEHLPLAPLRWERLDVDVGELDATTQAAEDALHDRILSAIDRRARQELGAGSPHLRVVAWRVRLVGETERHRDAAAFVARRDAHELLLDHGGVLHVVEKLVDATRPALDLDALAERTDPLGLLARKVRALERGDAEAEALVARARRRADAVAGGSRAWDLLDAPTSGRGSGEAAAETGPLGMVDLRERLRRAAWRALRSLDAQRADAEGGSAGDDAEARS